MLGGKARVVKRGKPVSAGDRSHKRGGQPGGQAGPRRGSETPVTAPLKRRDHVVISGLSARQILSNLANDPNTNDAARTSAARALAEMDGAIGRHAPPPMRDKADVAVLSRADLVRELERLRAACQAVPPA
jgi:hypothetical protein